LGSIGNAVVNYTGNSENLKITVNAGQTINLISGPSDFDALSRLGIASGVLSAPATGSTSTTTSTSGSTPTYGLGLTGGIAGSMDISTKTGADLTRSQLLSVLSNIQQAYQTSNTPPQTAASPGNTSAAASPASTAQLASYSAALSLLGNTTSNATNNIALIIAGGTPSNAPAAGTGIVSLFNTGTNTSTDTTSLF
jgi:hypothetical protein